MCFALPSFCDNEDSDVWSIGVVLVELLMSEKLIPEGADDMVAVSGGCLLRVFLQVSHLTPHTSHLTPHTPHPTPQPVFSNRFSLYYAVYSALYPAPQQRTPNFTHILHAIILIAHSYNVTFHPDTTPLTLARLTSYSPTAFSPELLLPRLKCNRAPETCLVRLASSCAVCLVRRCHTRDPLCCYFHCQVM
jgi:hypothetical protein